jgi:hypothetical protein
MSPTLERHATRRVASQSTALAHHAGSMQLALLLDDEVGVSPSTGEMPPLTASGTRLPNVAACGNKEKADTSGTIPRGFGRYQGHLLRT